MYEQVELTTQTHRPWVYANFVATIDGMVAARGATSEYWPLGSEEDFEAMLHLRARADLLVHGRKTAMMYRALNRLEDSAFQARRRTMRKEAMLPYAVVSREPDDKLMPFLSSASVPTYLLTSQMAQVSKTVENHTQVIRHGEVELDIQRFLTWCHTQKYKHVLVEGGPSLVRAFVDAGCLDELFLTITPKLMGGDTAQIQTLLGGALLSPKEVIRVRLSECQTAGDEVFLRYRFTHI